MVYRVIGVAGNELQQGLNLLYVALTETGGKWTHEAIAETHFAYDPAWRQLLLEAPQLQIVAYTRLHNSFGSFIGEQVNRFIRDNQLDHQVHLVVSNGHPLPGPEGQPGSIQLGHGAYIAAKTGLPVVSDLLCLDQALGGAGAPMAAVAAKLLPAGEIRTPYADTLTVALAGILRWREEANMLSAATGAQRDSSGGTLWLGMEA